jgi:nitrite reductase/ring-hydroxylating ferredoxin subunit
MNGSGRGRRRVSMNFVEVAKVNEIPEGTMKACKAGEQEIIVVNSGGKFYALNRRCTHKGGDLSEGKLEGSAVRCPWHGALFDLATGKKLEGPKIGPIRIPVKDEICYSVEIAGGAVKVRI